MNVETVQIKATSNTSTKMKTRSRPSTTKENNKNIDTNKLQSADHQFTSNAVEFFSTETAGPNISISNEHDLPVDLIFNDTSQSNVEHGTPISSSRTRTRTRTRPSKRTTSTANKSSGLQTAIRTRKSNKITDHHSNEKVDHSSENNLIPSNSDVDSSTNLNAPNQNQPDHKHEQSNKKSNRHHKPTQLERERECERQFESECASKPSSPVRGPDPYDLFFFDLQQPTSISVPLPSRSIDCTAKFGKKQSMVNSAIAKYTKQKSRSAQNHVHSKSNSNTNNSNSNSKSVHVPTTNNSKRTQVIHDRDRYRDRVHDQADDRSSTSVPKRYGRVRTSAHVR
jgi:hypothetical protein